MENVVLTPLKVGGVVAKGVFGTSGDVVKYVLDAGEYMVDAVVACEGLFVFFWALKDVFLVSGLVFEGMEGAEWAGFEVEIIDFFVIYFH